MMRPADLVQQVQPSRSSHQHRHHQRNQQQQQHQHQPEKVQLNIQRDQTCSNSVGDNATRRSSGRRSKHHRHHQHDDGARVQRHSSHRRRHLSAADGDTDNDKNPLDADNTNEDAGTAFSTGENSKDAQTALGDASNSLGPHSSLIDQMLIFCAKNAQQQPATSATAAVACNSRRRKGHSQQHQMTSGDATVVQLQGIMSNGKTTSQCQEDSAEVILGSSSFTGVKAESAAGKGLAKQWEVTKQFVLAICFNTLSQRMRDLQQTEEPVLAAKKLAVLRQLRQLTDAVRRVDPSKQLYSSAGVRAKKVTAALGFQQRSLSPELLHKWSSRENEYQLYWMAILEKMAASLANCQDLGVLQQHLQFAQDLVEVQGFPLS